MVGVGLAFHLFLIAALQPLTSAAAPAPAEAPPDIEQLMQAVQRVHFVDMAAWSRFRFDRQVDVEQLDDEGRVVSNESYRFEVTPAGGRFDEQLTSLDGRAPSPREVKHHRKKAHFNRHYNAIRSGREDGQDDEGSPLTHLLYMSDYTYAGREEVDGIPCYRLDFSPQEESGGGGLQARIAKAMAGSLWISVEDQHLVRAHARTERPVSIALSLAKVHEVQVDLLNKPVSAGVWLPERLEIATNGRISWWPFRRRSIFRYSGFEPVHHTTAEVTGGETSPSF